MVFQANYKIKGLSLPEILGATLIVLTLATVSVLTVRDTLSAGQRSAVQRELQGLNAALTSFRGAGGVIESGSTPPQAVDALMNGVDLDTSKYQPLTRRPPEVMEVAGAPLYLNYEDNGGFTYTSEDTVGSGDEDTHIMPEAAYPFDISNADAIQQALAVFADMSDLDPLAQSYLDAFNTIRNLGQHDITSDMKNPRVYDIGGIWTFPDPSYLMSPMTEAQWEQFMRTNYRLGGFDPGYVAETYGSEEGLQDYVRQVHGSWKNWAMPIIQEFYGTGGTANPILESYSAPTTPGQWATVTEKLSSGAGPEYFFALSNMSHEGQVDSNWSTNIDWQRVPSLAGFRMNFTDLSGSNINGELLNTIPVVKLTDSTTTVWGSTSNASKNSGDFRGTGFRGLNLTGLNLSGRILRGSDFTNASGLSAENLALSAQIDKIILTGTGITRAKMEEAWQAANKDLAMLPTSITFDTEPVSGSYPSPTPTPRTTPLPSPL